MGRGGQGHRGGEARQEGDAVGYHRLHPRAHRGLQDAEVGRLHRSPAPQRLRQDPAPPPARSLLGGEGSPGELTRLKYTVLPHQKSHHPRKRVTQYSVALEISCTAAITGYSACAEYD